MQPEPKTPLRGRHAPLRRSGRPSPLLQSLLVPIDLTPTSDRVLGRLAHLPLAAGAQVTLVHVVPGSLPLRERRAAERDARHALGDEARHLAASLPEPARIRSVIRTGSAAREIADAARTRNADLIVMGRGGGRALRDVFLGSTAERVMRTAKLPVLAVRMAARAPYRRPAAALDVDPSSRRVFAWLLRLLAEPRPVVDVVHAFEAPYERLVYRSLSEDAVEERRAALREAATVELGALLRSALALSGISAADAPWRLHARRGSPRLVVARAVREAHVDLLALGTHAYSGLAHVFLGTVAGDLLRDVACDVLVVPPDDRTPVPA